MKKVEQLPGFLIQRYLPKMANDKILLTYVAADLLFVVSGGLLLIFALTSRTESNEVATLDNVARDILLNTCPLNAAIGNAVMVFFTFLVTVPGIVIPTTRGWLKFAGYLSVVCGLFTMIIGLTIWFETLKTRSVLSTIWNASPSATQSLLQQKFSCCGYNNSTSPLFVADTTCTTPAVAASLPGCVSKFSSFANIFLDVVFTGAFGIVGIDVAFVLATAMILKDRKEKERYRGIDEKTGVGAF